MAFIYVQAFELIHGTHRILTPAVPKKPVSGMRSSFFRTRSPTWKVLKQKATKRAGYGVFLKTLLAHARDALESLSGFLSFKVSKESVMTCLASSVD